MHEGRKLAFAGCVEFDVNRIQELADKLHAVPCFVVYEKPADFPDNVVVRLIFAGSSNDAVRITSDNAAIVVSSVAEARKCIPIAKMGLTLFPRSKKDAVSLVETWI